MQKIKRQILFVTILSCAIVLSGCAAMDKQLTRPAPNPVQVLTTNAAGNVVVGEYTPLELNPALLPYYQTADAITPLLPTPAREIAGGLLLALAGAATQYVRTRNRIREAEARADAENAANAETDAALRSVVKAVEKSSFPQVKEAIRKQAIKDDSEPVLRRVVNEVTG
jgi:hypothetical protein